jgi:hypothetical protein
MCDYDCDDSINYSGCGFEGTLHALKVRSMLIIHILFPHWVDLHRVWVVVLLFVVVLHASRVWILVEVQIL